MQRDDHARMRAVADGRAHVGGIEALFAIVAGAFVAGQRAPMCQRAIPGFALRRHRPTLQVGKRRFVRRNQCCARARFDRHVAQGHALFHVQRADGAAKEFQHMPGAAIDADPADQVQGQVLGAGLRRQFALDMDGEILRLALQQALRRQHVADLGGTDAEGQRAEGAVRGGVAVAADDGHARLRSAQFRADHVHDAAAVAAPAVQRDAELHAIGFQLLHLRGRLGIGVNMLAQVVGGRSRRGMIKRRQHALRIADGQVACAQLIEGLRRSHFVDQVQVDVQDARRGLRFSQHLMGDPQFVQQGAFVRGHHAASISRVAVSVTGVSQPHWSAVLPSNRPKKAF